MVAVGSIAEVCCDRTERDGDFTVIYSLSWWVVLKVVVMRTSYTEVAHPRYRDVAGRVANLVSPPCSMGPVWPTPVSTELLADGCIVNKINGEYKIQGAQNVGTSGWIFCPKREQMSYG